MKEISDKKTWKNPEGIRLHNACSLYLMGNNAPAVTVPEEVSLLYMNTIKESATEYNLFYKGDRKRTDIIHYNKDNTIDIIEIKTGNLFIEYPNGKNKILGAHNNNYVSACIQLSEYKLTYTHTHRLKVDRLIIANITDGEYKLYIAHDFSNYLNYYKKNFKINEKRLGVVKK